MKMALIVLEEVADRENTHPHDLPILRETIDPDLLQRFVDSPADDSLAVEFPYCGRYVTVSGTGNVDITSG